MAKTKSKVGESNFNNIGLHMKIVAYRGCNDIDIQFDDGTIVTNKRYGSFKCGRVKNPMHKCVYGVGFFGIGEYSSRLENGCKSDAYKKWQGMLQRCYDKNFQNYHPTYKNCIVCEEWHNFQNFAKWYDDNYYEINGETIELDKDILIKGNNVYSPETCILVPKMINTLFTKSNCSRGNLPIGVFREGEKFRSMISIGKMGKKCFGTFNNVEEAYLEYKKGKEKYIKEIADKYKDKIPKKLYNALYNYEVDIND